MLFYLLNITRDSEFWTDEHVFGEPSLAPGDARSDAQGEALFSQQWIPAVAAAIWNYFAGLWTLNNNSTLWIARPIVAQRPVQWQWSTNRVQAPYEVAIAQRFHYVLTHPCHNAHRRHHVGRVGNLDANLRHRRANRSHAERDHIHGST